MDSYESIVKNRMVKKQDSTLLGGAFNGKGSYPHIFKELKHNFIDLNYPTDKCIKGDLQKGSIQYHYANHLNSSQAMCIGYFKKFFEKPEYELLLAEILMILKIDVAGTSFKDAVFEYVPDLQEGTNFDFYLTLTNGKHISWEVKFTEAEFGGTQKQKGAERRYITKWEETYLPMLQQCVYYNFPDVTCDDYQCLSTGMLTDDCPVHDRCSIHQFYRYYQIRRNILYATQDGDYVLFLTPKENANLDKGRNYIEWYAQKWGADCIRNIYWEDLLLVTLRVVSCEPDLLKYYQQFKDKYFLEDE